MEDVLLKKRILRIFPGIFLLVLQVFLLSSCTNIAFQPSRKMFFDPASFGYKYEDVFFKSRDGTRLHGWLFHADPGKKESGLIVQFHGNAENLSTHFMSLAWATKYGYSLFVFDYQGYGKSGGKAGHRQAFYDALAAMDFGLDVKKKREAEGLGDYRLILYGQSIGGNIMLRALSDWEHFASLDAIVIDSSFTSYRAIAREKLSLSFITWPFQPLSYLLFSDKYAAEAVIENLSPVPALVIHGDKDRIIPIDHGERLYGKLKDPKSFWRIEGGSHISANTSETFRKRFVDFLDNLSVN